MKIELFPKTTLRISKHNRRAVSDVVAVLILIVIAIIGAVAVGLILSTTSHSVGMQAASNGNGNSAQSTLYIAGSTTIYPISLAAQQAFENQYHVNVVLAQGGSNAGMQAVISGATDIGAASSASAVQAAQAYVTANGLPVNLEYTLIGGSGIVIIENSGTGYNFLNDGSASNLCYGITKGALIQIIQMGKFGIITGSCEASTYSTLQADPVLYGATTGTAAGVCALSGSVNVTGVTASKCTASSFYGPVTFYDRSDSSGTEDTLASYTGVCDGVSPTGCGASLFAGTGENGNPALVKAVQSATTPAIGFTDLGFAEGKASGVTCQSGWSAAAPTACEVSIAQVDTNAPAAVPAAATAKSNGYVAYNTPTTPLHLFIQAALASCTTLNPLQNSACPNAYPDSSGALTRTFYYVTNGAPTPVEQEWLSFMTSYNAESYYTNNGYFSVYDFSTA